MATFKTRKIAVVGAGNLGSHCAFALALQGACEQIVFVDSNYPRAQAQAQDLEDTMTAMPHAVQVWAGSYSDCVDANLVLFCGGSFPKDCESPQNAWEASMRAADQLIPVLRDGGFKGVLVVASDPCEVLACHFYHNLDLEQGHVLGTGTMIDTARLCQFLAKWLEVDARSVSAYVLGTHGESQVVPWSVASVGGARLFDLMSSNIERYGSLDLSQAAEKVRHMGWRILDGKGTVSFGPAMAAAKLCKAVLCDERCILTVSTLLNGEYGQCGVFASVPAVIGCNGVKEICFLQLSEGEQTEFSACCEAIRNFSARCCE